MSDARDATDPPRYPWSSTPKGQPQFWVSRFALAACISVFLCVAVKGGPDSWASAANLGYLPAEAIWDGHWWALVTSAFVHYEIWHLAFNAYWLWVLGSRLELALGSPRHLGFVVVSAFVSSSFQLAVSGQTGIGASGVVYAIFGFMWVARHRHPQFQDVLNRQTFNVFIIWLLGCIVVTHLELINIGNAAHVSGLLFGCAAAACFAVRFKPRLTLAGLIALVALSVIPLLWRPWSATWLSKKAYAAHVAKEFGKALDLYDRVIRMEPDNAWTYYNRGCAREELGDRESAQADIKKALEIDPAVGDWE